MYLVGYHSEVSEVLSLFKTYLIILRNFCFLLALLISATTIKFLSKQVSYPSLIIYSLTYTQAFLKSSPKELMSFIREKRFSEYFDTSKVLWEVRSWRPKRFVSPGFTYDASFFLFTRCISWKSMYLTARKIVDLNALSTNLKLVHLKDVYTKGFQKFVWTVSCQELTHKVQLVTTQSTIKVLPHSFHENYIQKTIRIMIWYSINSQGITRDFTSPEGISLDAIEGKIDQQFVWTDSHKELLKNQGVGQIHVVGSCLFQANPQTSAEKKNVDELNILFFDVNPVRDNLLKELSPQLDFQESIYDYEFCSRQLLESISVLTSFSQSQGRSLTVKLKPKRSVGPKAQNYNLRYVRLLRDLEIKDSRFSIMSPDANLYSIIKNADLVLGPVYTSPVFVARELNVPSCYLAFNAYGWRIKKSLDSIPVLFSAKEFREFLNQTFLY